MVSYLTKTYKYLEEATKIAKESETRSKEIMKAYYDEYAREREFQPNDLLLLLLPTS